MPVRNKTYKLLQEKHDILNTVYQSALGDIAYLQAENKQFEQIATDRQTQNTRLAEGLANLQREFAQLKEQCSMVSQDWAQTTQENEQLRAQHESAAHAYEHMQALYEKRLQSAHNLLTRADDIFRFIPVSRQSAANRLQIVQWRLDVIEAMNGVETSN